MNAAVRSICSQAAQYNHAEDSNAQPIGHRNDQEAYPYLYSSRFGPSMEGIVIDRIGFQREFVREDACQYKAQKDDAVFQERGDLLTDLNPPFMIAHLYGGSLTAAVGSISVIAGTDSSVDWTVAAGVSFCAGLS